MSSSVHFGREGSLRRAASSAPVQPSITYRGRETDITKKLLIVSPSQGGYGGVEAFVVALATQMQANPEFAVQVCFKLVGGYSWREDLKDVTAKLACPVHYVDRGSFRLLDLIRWADVVHGQNTSPDIVFPAKLAGRKLVLTIHNWRRPGRGIRSLLWGLGAALADRRWYNSRFVWSTWEPARTRAGSDCIPTVCGLPDTWCPPEQRKGFLFVGRWIENKGIEELVTAYAQAQLDPVRFPLILIGNGPLRPKVQALIKELNAPGVEVLGFVDDRQKGMRLASSRWLVAPARTREDLGLTPIEARSVGVPVIVTRDGGLPEAGGDAALIVEPGSIQELKAALIRAAGMDEAEYRARGERGRATLKEFLRPMKFYDDSYAALLEQ